jgi:hypothetical protein
MEFLVIGIIFAPKAHNAAESRLILERSFDAMMPAFPNAQRPVQIGTIEGTPERPALEAGRDPEPTDADFETLDDDDSESAHDETSPGGEALSEPQNPLGNQPPPPGSSIPNGKITHEKITFLNAIAPLKSDLLALMGPFKGSAEYYKLLLEVGGVQHANQLTDVGKQGTFFRKLEKIVKLLKENPVATEPAKPPRNFMDDLLDMRREAFNRMAMERLSEHLDELVSTCPANQYPPNITEIIQSGDKAKMINLAVELVRINLLEAARMRDQQNAKGSTGRQ